MAVVVRTRRNVSLLVVVWILVGLVVAAQRGYLTVGLLKAILSAVLAIVLVAPRPARDQLPPVEPRRAVPLGTAQSLISQITAPVVTVCADLGGEPGDRAGLVGGERLLHLHRLEHDDEVALGDGLRRPRRRP